MIGVYTLGFVLPFLAVGLFTTTLLELFKKYQKVVRYTVKIGGLLMVLMGILMFTGKMNSVTGYLSKLSESSKTVQNSQTEEDKDGQKEAAEDSTEKTQENVSEEAQGQEEDSGDKVPAVDFTLKDQYGEEHTLEEYKGKTIFLNFWATWCPPCKAEMPDIQEIYENYDTEGEDALVVLGVAAPSMGQEGTEEEIKAFLDENGYTYPVLMDTEGKLFEAYGIYSYPTTFMIDREGNIFGYVSGMLTKDMMNSIIQQTMG